MVERIAITLRRRSFDVVEALAGDGDAELLAAYGEALSKLDLAPAHASERREDALRLRFALQPRPRLRRTP